MMTRDIQPSPLSDQPLTVSIIIPVLNEAEQLAPCLATIGRDLPGVDVWVVDGGSNDETVEIARQNGANVQSSPIGQRAAQMNLGASVAQGEVLLFLHADTQLPPNWLVVLRKALRLNPHIVGGGFRRRFITPSMLLRFTCWLADWRVRWWGCLFGDQAIFARREAFNAVGAFPSMKVFEDWELSMRLSALGKVTLLSATVTSSGRRFIARGAIRQTMVDIMLTYRYLRSRPQPSAEKTILTQI